MMIRATNVIKLGLLAYIFALEFGLATSNSCPIICLFISGG